MHYAPQNEPCPLPYSPFKACTVPRPIGWLSTISKNGTPNLAPYSQWQNLTFDPPMVMFAANQLSSGERKRFHDFVKSIDEVSLCGGVCGTGVASCGPPGCAQIGAISLASVSSLCNRKNAPRLHALHPQPRHPLPTRTATTSMTIRSHRK